MDKATELNCETQETIIDWAERTFGETTEQAALRRCALEFAELARALGWLNLSVQIHRALEAGPDWEGNVITDTERSNAREECADVLITLYRVMQTLGGDLHWAVDNKMVTNRARKWRVNPDGTGVHIKE